MMMGLAVVCHGIWAEGAEHGVSWGKLQGGRDGQTCSHAGSGGIGVGGMVPNDEFCWLAQAAPCTPSGRQTVESS